MTPGKEALWWNLLEGNTIECLLCPKGCHIAEGKTGYCRARKNDHGRLYSLAYGSPIAVHADPIEKKPLYHFYPGTYTFSLGTYGCNLGCVFCQNWGLSQAESNWDEALSIAPHEVVEAALRSRCSSVAFTYNEPTVWAEYVLDVSREAKNAGLKTVMVTNGYTSLKALPEVYPLISAANVDLKSFSEDFYRQHAKATLQPVLETLSWLKKNTDVWLEVTCLVIPEWNDSPEEIAQLAAWIHEHLGDDTPLHFSAFHPNYQLTDHSATSPALLRKATEIARRQGLRFVYEGNIEGDAAHTCCPRCRKLLIRRSWHSVIENCMHGNHCSCGECIPGRFT